MTLITSTGRTVKRETSASVRDTGKYRPIVVTLHPGFMMLRLKGRRSGYSLGYESALRLAVEQDRAAKKEERRRARKGLLNA